MLALTILQPWAYAIRHLGKDIENRMWTPPAKLIGERFCVHAGKLDEATFRRQYDQIRDAFDSISAAGISMPEKITPRNLIAESGAIVAVATLDSVVTESDSPWFVGKYGWKLRDVVNIEPAPCRGAQKLWRVPDDIATQVRERYELASRRAA